MQFVWLMQLVRLSLTEDALSYRTAHPFALRWR
jgi:hypothetical protein